MTERLKYTGIYYSKVGNVGGGREVRDVGARNGTWDGRGGGTKRYTVRDQTGSRTKGKRKVGQD